ncbi:hypothetical protein L6452_05926 [Arctium lappa]|uniref:Uncharacterized protein n=1 Tax=Arctium lappa TaxID=4217 RepID=A0ACB9EIT4_ARCLA|nr:hypothetical protein L6452_05926 [Arctium lappa]
MIEEFTSLDAWKKKFVSFIFSLFFHTHKSPKILICKSPNLSARIYEELIGKVIMAHKSSSFLNFCCIDFGL